MRLRSGLDAFTEQSQAMGACRCIWAALGALNDND